MIAKFWEGTGGDLSKKWAELLFGPAFLFWLGAILLATRPIGWEKVWQWLVTGNSFEQVARLVVGLLVVAFSSYLVSRVNFGVLRLLEGYFPLFLGWLADWLAGFQQKKFNNKEIEWQALKKRARAGTTSRAERQKLAALEMELHYAPTPPDAMMPTTLGNIIRTGELLPGQKYGLDTVVCWSHLWLVLPETAQSELTAVRQQLNRLAGWWSWGLLSLMWMYWLPWLGMVSVVWLWLVYRLMLPVARQYADLIEAAFDLYRWELYQHLHLPLPASSADEIAHGEEITALIWRGPPTKKTLTYEHPSK